MTKFKAMFLVSIISGCAPAFAKIDTVTKNPDGTVTVTTILSDSEKDAKISELKEKLNIAQIHLESYQDQERRAAQGVIDSQTEINDLMQEITDLETAK